MGNVEISNENKAFRRFSSLLGCADRRRTSDLARIMTDVFVRLLCTALLFATTSIPGANANDASISASPAGLVFEKNHDIAIISEYLRISLKEIRVDYEFLNISKRAVTIKVGFPLPLFEVSPETEGEFSFRFNHDENFNVWVDGVKISSKLDVRVYDSVDSTSGHDITRAFLAAGLNPFLPPGESPEVIEKLKKLNLWSDEGEAGGSWTAQKTYYWEQTFPPGKFVRISHRYRPWAGGFPEQTAIQYGFSIFAGPYCIDKKFVDQFARLTGFPLSQYTYETDKIDGKSGYVWTKNSQYGAGWTSDRPLQEADIRYVLKTGADWAGPIRRFTLQIDKGDAILVSFCPPPRVSISRKGNAFIGSVTDFTPTTDLEIYFMGPNVYPALP